MLLFHSMSGKDDSQSLGAQNEEKLEDVHGKISESHENDLSYNTVWMLY